MAGWRCLDRCCLGGDVRERVASASLKHEAGGASPWAKLAQPVSSGWPGVFASRGACITIMYIRPVSRRARYMALGVNHCRGSREVLHKMHGFV